MSCMHCMSVHSTRQFRVLINGVTSDMLLSYSTTDLLHPQQIFCISLRHRSHLVQQMKMVLGCNACVDTLVYTYTTHIWLQSYPNAKTFTKHSPNTKATPQWHRMTTDMVPDEPAKVRCSFPLAHGGQVDPRSRPHHPPKSNAQHNSTST